MTHSKPRILNGSDFATAHALQEWLHAQGIDVSRWGRGEAKAVAHLWHELRHGDTRIQAAPPLRLVDVAQVLIRRGERVLVESIQEFGDGQRRFRSQPPAEKMRSAESYLDAARRCLQEELGITPQQATFDAATYRQIEVVGDSPSYPGLPTRYTFHRMEAAVSGLPESDFWRENVSEHDGDPVARHFWAWRRFDSADGWPPLPLRAE